jgi:MoxR-like ATPase
MKQPPQSTFYAPGSAAAGAPDLPPSVTDVMSRPDRYLPEDDLVHAVNVALLLGQPLLVTGEPGTGKSTLSASIAYSLFENRYLRYDVKSATTRTDLLYHYDAMARLRDCQSGRPSRPLLDYLRFNALGEGIIRAIAPDSFVYDMLGKPLDLDHPMTPELFGEEFIRRPKLRDLVASPGLRLKTETGGDEAERWVILIDEIDKAARDLPNDLLGELDRMEFDIPEIGVRICNPAPPGERIRPFIIITSNAEKNLPNAFLRRCAYFHIPFPERVQIKKIIELRLADVEGAGRILATSDVAIDTVARLRSVSLKKPPGLFELLSWLVLIGRDTNLAPGCSGDEMALRHLSALIKDAEDIEAAKQALRPRKG